jgi:hypothetical protein
MELSHGEFVGTETWRLFCEPKHRFDLRNWVLGDSRGTVSTYTCRNQDCSNWLEQGVCSSIVIVVVEGC